MKIFIGSASESKVTAEWIAALVAECGHSALPWYDTGVFPAGQVTFPRLVELSKEVDAAIFVFGEDDETSSRGRSPRISWCPSKTPTGQPRPVGATTRRTDRSIRQMGVSPNRRL